MRLYLDDDTIHGVLVGLLRKAGHDAQIPGGVQLGGAADAVQLMHAIRSDRVFVTYNYDDFKQLHDLIRAASGNHPGIIVLRRDSDRRDMKPGGIVRALGKLALSGDPIRSYYTILNDYR